MPRRFLCGIFTVKLPGVACHQYSNQILRIADVFQKIICYSLCELSVRTAEPHNSGGVTRAVLHTNNKNSHQVVILLQGQLHCHPGFHIGSRSPLCALHDSTAAPPRPGRQRSHRVSHKISPVPSRGRREDLLRPYGVPRRDKQESGAGNVGITKPRTYTALHYRHICPYAPVRFSGSKDKTAVDPIANIAQVCYNGTMVQQKLLCRRSMAPA